MATTSDSLHNLHSPERGYSGEILCFGPSPHAPFGVFSAGRNVKIFQFPSGAIKDNSQMRPSAECDSSSCCWFSEPPSVPACRLRRVPLVLRGMCTPLFPCLSSLRSTFDYSLLASNDAAVTEKCPDCVSVRSAWLCCQQVRQRT